MAITTSIDTLTTTINQGKTSAQQLRAYAVQLRNKTATSNTSAAYIFGVFDKMRGDHRAKIEAVAARPGMGPFTQEQLGRDEVADYQAAFDALELFISEFVALVPKTNAAQGSYLLVETINANGDRVSREFTPAQTAGLRSRLDALIAAIE